MALTQITQAGTKDEAINEAKIQISNAGSDGQILTKRPGNAGGLTWENAAGGVGGATGVDFNDNVATRYGDANELQIKHSSSGKSIIYHSPASTVLSIAADHLNLADYGNEHAFITCDRDGSVELYYDNVWKLKTASNGTHLNDSLFINDADELVIGTDSDLKLYHDGNSWINHNGAGGLVVRATTNNLYLQSDSNIFIGDVGGNEYFIKCVDNAQVELYYDGTKKFETTSDGAKVTGNLTVTTGNSILTNSSQGQLTIKGGATYPGGAIKFAGGQSGATDQGTLLFYAGTDTSLEMRFRIHADGRVQIPNDTGKFQCGSSSDLEIYHDGTDSHIDFKSGQLNIRPENTAGSYENGIIIKQNDAVELYYNDSKKFNTKSNGVTVLGDIGFASAGDGIDFGANSHASGMSSEKLDGYEEGTWTPIPTFGGGNTGISYSSTGQYIRVGRKVTALWEVVFTNRGSSTGQFQITGLPFTPSRSGQGAALGYIHRVETDYSGQLTAWTSGSTLWFGTSGIDGNFVNWSNSDLRNDTHLNGTITYICN